MEDFEKFVLLCFGDVIVFDNKGREERIFIWLLLFSPYSFLARSIFFSFENALEVFGFHNSNLVFPLL